MFSDRSFHCVGGGGGGRGVGDGGGGGGGGRRLAEKENKIDAT